MLVRLNFFATCEGRVGSTQISAATTLHLPLSTKPTLHQGNADDAKLAGGETKVRENFLLSLGQQKTAESGEFGE